MNSEESTINDEIYTKFCTAEEVAEEYLYDHANNWKRINQGTYRYEKGFVYIQELQLNERGPN